MALRARRLASDAQTIRRCFGPDSPIRILDAQGDPPERYRLEYRVKSLVVQNGEVVPSPRQIVEVYLTLSYPRQAPQCRMLTPVFHPNIAPHAVCIGDHWSAGESLAALLVRMAEMLTFQSYNLQSPLNGDAAKWADEHMRELPLEECDFNSLLAGANTVESLSSPPSPVASTGSAEGVAQASVPGETPEPGVFPGARTDPQAPAVAAASDLGSPEASPSGTAATPDRPSSRLPESIPLSPMTEDIAVDATDALVLEDRGRPLVSDRPPSPDSLPRPAISPPRTTECPFCHAALSIPENWIHGSWMRCPLCGGMLRA